MKSKLVFFIILFISFNNTGHSLSGNTFKNLVILNEPKKYDEIIFKDIKEKDLNLNDFKSDIYLLNFWASWCAPCKKEMPSLNEIQNIKGIKVLPINVETYNKKKSEEFFKELNINNLSIYFDYENNLAKLFSLRGIPTTIIFNKNKNEIARILGEFDFSDKKFVKWLKSIN